MLKDSFKYYEVSRSVKRRSNTSWLGKIKLIRNDTHEVCKVNHATAFSEEEALRLVEEQLIEFDFEKIPLEYDIPSRKFVFEVIHTQRKISDFYQITSELLSFSEHSKILSQLEDVKDTSVKSLLGLITKISSAELVKILDGDFSLDICMDEYDVTEIHHALGVLKFYAQMKLS